MIVRAAVAVFVVVATVSAGQAPPVTLTGYASLPADVFAAGPPSGAWRRPGKEGIAEFPSQPVQGVSAIWPAAAGGDDWFVLSDNGFGARINSSDALLRIHRMRVEWASSASDGNGRVVVSPSFIQLADPDRKLPFPIVRGDTRERWLTGADLDTESFVRTEDGSFWIGDEFGPFLFHVDAKGRVLEPPLEVPGLRSPDHPHLQPADAGQVSPAKVRRSRGFEALAAAPGSRLLHAALESPPAGAAAGATPVFVFDVEKRAFAAEGWTVALTPDHALTELVGLEAIFGDACADYFLGIERDDGHGPKATRKHVYEIRLAGGRGVRSLVVDLLDIANPLALGGHPDRFTFPYITIEAVWPLDRQTLVVVNDNNFPASGGRPGVERDPTEFIRLRLSRPLCGD